MEKQFSFEPMKLRLYQLRRNIAAKIAPHTSSALRDLGVIFDKSILSRSSILVGEGRVATEEFYHGTKINRKTHRIMLLRDISEER